MASERPQSGRPAFQWIGPFAADNGWVKPGGQHGAAAGIAAACSYNTTREVIDDGQWRSCERLMPA